MFHNAWKSLAGCALALLLLPNGATADTILYAFTDGGGPTQSSFDAAGNLYGLDGGGIVSSNCPSGCGVIYKLTPDGTKTVLYSFKGGPTDGAGPSGIVVTKNGTIYGATGSGGTKGWNIGTVFKLTPDGQETILYSFPAPKGRALKSPNGLFPESGIILGHDGNFYGTTEYGGFKPHGPNACGMGGCGTVFKITPHGKHTVLYAFKGPGDGCQALSALTQDQAGYLYGTTIGCGGGNYGTVYKIDPTTGIETVLHVFAEGTDGNAPTAPPVLDAAGNLYGTTTVGGNTGCGGPNPVGPGCGIVFKIATDGTYSILHTFTGVNESVHERDQDGGVAGRPLYIDGAGNLYSTTLWGGNALCNDPYGCGTVWQMTPDGTYSVLYRFNGPLANDAWLPYTGLIPSPDGASLVGTTGAGPGSGCCGALYSIKK